MLVKLSLDDQFRGVLVLLFDKQLLYYCKEVFLSELRQATKSEHFEKIKDVVFSDLIDQGRHSVF